MASTRPGMSHQSSLPRAMRILEEVVERYLQDLRPERSEVMREMEEHAERDSHPDRALGDRPPARGALPGARPGRPRGGHGDRLLDAAHGRAARARARGHARARSRARRAGARLPRARRRGRPRGDRRGRRARDAAGPRGPVRPPVRRREQGRVRALHRACRVEALRAGADGRGQPADERRGGAARGRGDPLELRTRSPRRADSTASCSARSDWLACVLPVGDGIGVAARR